MSCSKWIVYTLKACEILCNTAVCNILSSHYLYNMRDVKCTKSNIGMCKIRMVFKKTIKKNKKKTSLKK